MTRILVGVIAATVAFGLTSELTAQPPASLDPNSNFSRAYRHFLNSPYSYRVISAPQPGHYEEVVTPYSRESFYVEPSQFEQRITPYAFESREYVPGYGGQLTTPWFTSGYRVPGYERGFVAPHPGQWR